LLLSKSDEKILHEITVNNQCYLNPFSRIVGFSVTPQLHVTFSWHLGIGGEDFAGAPIARW